MKVMDIESSWPVQWVHGCNSEPKIQVHRLSEGFFVLRQSKRVNFEGNFLYLIVGSEVAILFDTGAVSDSDSNLVECVMKIISMGTLRLPLVVAHTHSHGDHISGDSLFYGLDNVIVIEHGIDAVSSYFGFKVYAGEVLDMNSCSVYNLGGRSLEIFHIPGHYSDHIAVFDRSSGVLLTGDFIYPGRLYVYDRASFHDSVKFLNSFCNAYLGEIKAVLGSHIEMTNTAGFDYPDGSLYQPDEHPLALTAGNIAELLNAVEDANRQKPLTWGVLNLGFCVVVPTDLFESAATPYTATASHTCIALISELYITESDQQATPQDRLTSRLNEARQRGASIALLPELPMDRWYPSKKQNEDKQVLESYCVSGMLDSRIVFMSNSAREAGIILVGGVIMRPVDLPVEVCGDFKFSDLSLEDEKLAMLLTPRNISLIFSSSGKLIGSHMKQVLPREEGFWEGDYFAPSPSFPTIKRGIVPGFPLCIQTCSDIMRPTTAHILSALGSCVILNPRATEAASSERWRSICVGIAATTASYLLSVPRPQSEDELSLGGEAFCISPSGRIMSSLDTSSALSDKDPITLCDIDAMEIGEARVNGYPGYLTTLAAEYSVGWKAVADYIKSFN